MFTARSPGRWGDGAAGAGAALREALAGLWAPGRGCERAVGRARGWKEEGGVGGLMMKKSPPSRLLN